ncbi:hypothetical protein FEM48_Zijuj03G0079900 [Ziziphus jujuba var. spinosa]|uniref:Chalcone-flavonone isomerase family protein n=1 Tax=Ziziphus jujuba var. spinosa TaxID=714518 RepID=A0A978VP43_ZIZJJ|nr:hypothetical protein FEM48_Zijuj03G0079900 [Ziziphus jujuba var. spinosa]
MAPTLSVTGINVDNVEFPPSAKPPGSKNTLFLGGAGVRGLNIEGKFVKFTAIGVYLEDNAIPWLTAKWKGKNSEELTESDHFFRDIVTGPFEKLTRVAFISTLTGQQYSEKVVENSTAILKSWGVYNDSEAKAIQKFLDIFEPQTFNPGSSIFFSHSPQGSFKISFSKDDSIPEVWDAAIESRLLFEAVLESIIGKSGVSPATRKSLAARLPLLLKEISDDDRDLDRNVINGKVDLNQKVSGHGHEKVPERKGQQETAKKI